MTKSQRFIKDHKRILNCGRDFYNVDTTLMPKSSYKKSKLKVLFIFGSPSSVKSVSTTQEAINDFFISKMPDAFVDFAYMPDQKDVKLYDKYNMPYAIGNITHLDASHFDIIGFSISVLSEIVTAPSMIKSFERCDKPIPTTWSERKDKIIGDTPLILAGGITAACGDIMFGDLGDGRQAFVDCMYLGDIAKMDLLLNKAIESLGKQTIQEMIDDLFSIMPMLYQPQAYEIIFNDKNQIISNKKINPKAQDFVKPYYPHQMSDLLGIGRSVIKASGDNTGTIQTQVSEGAMMEGTLIRTDKGLVRVESLCPELENHHKHIFEGYVDSTCGKQPISHAFNQGYKELLLFKMKTGNKIGLTPDHPVEQIDEDGNSYFVRADELKITGYFLSKPSDVLGDFIMDTSSAELLGILLIEGELEINEKEFFAYFPKNHRVIKLLEDCRSIYEFEGDMIKVNLLRSFLFKSITLSAGRRGKIEKLPDEVLKMNMVTTYAFIRGLFGDNEKIEVRKEWIYTIQQLCFALGIYAEVYNFAGNGVIRISEEYKDALQKECVHYAILNIAPKIGDCCIGGKWYSKSEVNNHSKLFYDKIIEIQRIAYYCYDLTVPTKEKLMANGVSIHNCSAAGACSFKVAKGTKIWTEYGILPIEECVGTPQKVQAIQIEQAKNVVKQSPSKKVNVILKSGHSLSGDINHIYMVFEDGQLVERRAYELSSGDIVFRKLGSDFEYDYQQDKYGNILNEDKAQLLGFLHGDGHFRKPNGNGNIPIHLYTREGEEFYINLFRKLFDYKGEPRIVYDSVKTPGVQVFESIKSIDLKKFFYSDLGLESSYELYVPSVVFKSPKSVMRAYLRGVFQSDGWSNDNCIGVSSTSGRFIEDIALLLSYLGFDNSVITNSYWDKNESLYNRRVSYQVNIRKYYLSRFRSEIGFESKQMDSTLVDNWSPVSLPKTDELVALVRSLVKNRDELREMGIDSLYERVRDDKEDNVSINTLLRFKQYFPEIRLPKFYEEVASGTLVPDFIKEVITTEEEVEMYDVFETESNLCIFNSLLTHQCHEGQYSGGWVEKSKEQILAEIKESKKYNAGYKYKPYSFNCNYLEDYKGMLYEFLQLVPKVTFINMRMEELGRDVDALKMMKLVGSNRISAPIEGISPRIQNNLLNKCLSEESLEAFMDAMVHGKMTDIKVGGIFTGFEEDEDFQWIVDFVQRFKQRAHKEGGNFPFRLKVTPLVHYQLTPMEYVERRSARKSYFGEHWLSDEWYEKFKENQVFFKVNGFKYSTFLEQAIIDLGRSATEWMYKNIILQDIPVYSLRSFAKEEIVNELKKLINPKYFFEPRDPDNYISLSHRIHTDLMGSYMARGRRLYRAQKQGDIFLNEPDIRCLKTHEHAKTKCYSKSMIKEPMKIYNDVELVDGALQGEFREIVGCERCDIKEKKLARLNKPFLSTKNSLDIEGALRIPKILKVRFIIKRNEEYSILNPHNTAHTVVAKMLQQSELLHKYFHSIDGHSMFWSADADTTYITSGYQLIDVIFSSNSVWDELKDVVSLVNKRIKTTQIVDFRREFVDEKIKVDDLAFYSFSTTLPMELFRESNFAYKGEVRVKKDVLFDTIIDKNLRPPLFFQKGQVMGSFYIPLKYSPNLYMQGFLNAKKVSESILKNEINFNNVFVGRESTAICRCGKERALYSMLTGKLLPLGKDCMLKVINLKL